MCQPGWQRDRQDKASHTPELKVRYANLPEIHEIISSHASFPVVSRNVSAPSFPFHHHVHPSIQSSVPSQYYGVLGSASFVPSHSFPNIRKLLCMRYLGVRGISQGAAS